MQYHPDQFPDDRPHRTHRSKSGPKQRADAETYSTTLEFSLNIPALFGRTKKRRLRESQGSVDRLWQDAKGYEKKARRPGTTDAHSSYGRAALTYERAAKLSDDAYGVASDTTLRLRRDWAVSLSRSGQLDAAISCNEITIRRCAKSRPPKDLLTVEIMRWQAEFHRLNNDHHGEIGTHLKLVDRVECGSWSNRVPKVIYECRRDLSAALYRAGLDLGCDDHIKQAVTVSKRSLQLADTDVNGDRLERIKIRSELGSELYELKQYEEALTCFNTNIKVIRERLPDSNDEKAFTKHLQDSIASAMKCESKLDEKKERERECRNRAMKETERAKPTSARMKSPREAWWRSMEKQSMERAEKYGEGQKRKETTRNARNTQKDCDANGEKTNSISETIIVEDYNDSRGTGSTSGEGVQAEVSGCVRKRKCNRKIEAGSIGGQTHNSKPELRRNQRKSKCEAQQAPEPNKTASELTRPGCHSSGGPVSSLGNVVEAGAVNAAVTKPSCKTYAPKARSTMALSKANSSVEATPMGDVEEVTSLDRIQDHMQFLTPLLRENMQPAKNRSADVTGKKTEDSKQMRDDSLEIPSTGTERSATWVRDKDRGRKLHDQSQNLEAVVARARSASGTSRPVSMSASDLKQRRGVSESRASADAANSRRGSNIGVRLVPGGHSQEQNLDISQSKQLHSGLSQVPPVTNESDRVVDASLTIPTIRTTLADSGEWDTLMPPEWMDDLVEVEDGQGMRRTCSDNNLPAMLPAMALDMKAPKRRARAVSTSGLDWARDTQYVCANSAIIFLDLTKIRADLLADSWFDKLRRNAHVFLDKYDRGSRNVKIAVLDTGVAGSPQSFVPELIRQKKVRLRRGKQLAETLDPYEDVDGHGTHVAGLILQVCPYADVYIYRVTRGQGAPIEHRYVKDALADAIEKRIDIVSMSFGWEGDSDRELRAVIRRARENGLLLFAASSNDGLTRSGRVPYPARADGVIAVDAANGFGRPSPFNPPQGREERIMALGERVRSAYPETPGRSCLTPQDREKPGWKRDSGTSCATPIAAGIAGLVLEFSRQLPLSRDPSVEEHLKDVEGMREVFLELMSTKTEANSRFNFLDPCKVFSSDDGDLDGSEWDDFMSQRWFAAHKIVACLRARFSPSVGSLLRQRPWEGKNR
ncbi:uncharacterized protein EI97DRAFT_443440 [Westerdykella ornata]|uniref:Peptidase S8/S53 domain-containing protein n=1 Tax=Westerdykella ornata TaxID=318751 RepID=A0A6A6JJZ1_WESOR|nr:uncharacterized protein EI97DRAFT_443440 [Westerdykella ornata]KAF2275199.1 hypothetical protein EI97DRAFT_443440 [Westerdykella ornata]